MLLIALIRSNSFLFGRNKCNECQKSIETIKVSVTFSSMLKNIATEWIL